MTDRSKLLSAFLFFAGWGDARQAPLAGDASNRRYVRLEHPALGRAVLMDAPPDRGEDVSPFIRIASHLKGLGLSAPEILAKDVENGFLVLEDLGDALFAKVLQNGANQEAELYLAATDALVMAQDASPPSDLPTYGPEEMAEAACLAIDWYLAHAQDDPTDIRDVFKSRMLALLSDTVCGDLVLTQRDYHAENLIWLPKRQKEARVGLLDFQDAMLCHPAYDLASLLKDARRDVDPDVQAICIDHHIARAGYERHIYEAAYALCSAQRNLRILGVFARLCIRDGKPSYPDLMPRVWRNLVSDLAHPTLEGFGTWVKDVLPAPTPDIITRIKTAHA